MVLELRESVAHHEERKVQGVLSTRFILKWDDVDNECFFERCKDMIPRSHNMILSKKHIGKNLKYFCSIRVEDEKTLNINSI